jgi:probable HAF family extracellular repeat protein
MFPVSLKSVAACFVRRKWSGSCPPRRSLYRPRLETLEDRRLMAVSIIDLGTLPGGTFTHALAINNLGDVTGYGDVADGTYHAFLWKNGVMTDLGSMGGQNSGPYDINDEDQIVGDVQTPDGTTRAFLWQNGVMTVLNVGDDRGRTAAWGINNLGQIVGASIAPYDLTKTPHAFLWDNGVVKPIPSTLGGDASYAYDITDSGDVVGYAQTASGDTHAFFAHDVPERPVRMVDLGTLGGPRGRAYRLNDHGQVIGAASEGGRYDKAFLYDYFNGGMTGLGTLGGAFSYAHDINEAGIIVGYSHMSPPQIHAFVDINDQMIDLNSLLPDQYWNQLTEAQGINDNDQIVGYGYHNHQIHAFLMNLDDGSGRPAGDFSALVTSVATPVAPAASLVLTAGSNLTVVAGSTADAVAADLVQPNFGATGYSAVADVTAVADVALTDTMSNPAGIDGNLPALT